LEWISDFFHISSIIKVEPFIFNIVKPLSKNFISHLLYYIKTHILQLYLNVLIFFFSHFLSYQHFYMSQIIHFDFTETIILPLVCFKHHGKIYSYECSWCYTKNTPKIIPKISPIFFHVWKKSILKKIKIKNLWVLLLLLWKIINIFIIIIIINMVY